MNPAELLMDYTHQAQQLAVATQQLADAEADYVPSPGALSIFQLMSHAYLTEMDDYLSLQRMMATDKTTISPLFGTAAWAAGAASQSLPQMLAGIVEWRRHTRQLLHHAPATVWQHSAKHATLGKQTIAQRLERSMQRTALLLQMIERNKTAYAQLAVRVELHPESTLRIRQAS